MKTPECTEAKIGTVDNVHKICIQTKFDKKAQLTQREARDSLGI